MALKNDFKGVVYLTTEQYTTLSTKGTITINETTYNYTPETTLYMTPDPANYTIVYLTEAQYQELLTNGVITIGDIEYSYDENVMYMTPDPKSYVAEIVYLTQAQYDELYENGTITIDDITYTYDDGTIYLTPSDDTSCYSRSEVDDLLATKQDTIEDLDTIRSNATTAIDTANTLSNEVDTLNTKVESFESSINTNTSNISTLTTKVDTNTSNIETNENNITSLEGRVSTNETNISNLQTQVSTNTTSIATNASDIATLEDEVITTSGGTILNSYLYLKDTETTDNTTTTYTNSLYYSSIVLSEVYESVSYTTTITPQSIKLNKYDVEDAYNSSLEIDRTGNFTLTKEDGDNEYTTIFELPETSYAYDDGMTYTLATQNYVQDYVVANPSNTSTDNIKKITIASKTYTIPTATPLYEHNIVIGGTFSWEDLLDSTEQYYRAKSFSDYFYDENGYINSKTTWKTLSSAQYGAIPTGSKIIKTYAYTCKITIINTSNTAITSISSLKSLFNGDNYYIKAHGYVIPSAIMSSSYSDTDGYEYTDDGNFDDTMFYGKILSIDNIFYSDYDNMIYIESDNYCMYYNIAVFQGDVNNNSITSLDSNTTISDTIRTIIE